jgi:hypothetical protein
VTKEQLDVLHNYYAQQIDDLHNDYAQQIDDYAAKLAALREAAERYECRSHASDAEKLAMRDAIQASE